MQTISTRSSVYDQYRLAARRFHARSCDESEFLWTDPSTINTLYCKDILNDVLWRRDHHQYVKEDGYVDVNEVAFPREWSSSRSCQLLKPATRRAKAKSIFVPSSRQRRPTWRRGRKKIAAQQSLKTSSRLDRVWGAGQDGLLLTRPPHHHHHHS